MGKVKRLARQAAIFIAIILSLITAYIVSPSFGLGAIAATGVFLLYLVKSRPLSNKYINKDGYYAFKSNHMLVHRFIAKKVLGRDLQRNEVVHHINGQKTDNRRFNLCVMDAEKHEQFHSWLSWKKRKSGRYPDFVLQKRILVEDYKGILLEKSKIKSSQGLITPRVSHSSASLFEELRKERLRLANERNLRAYEIFGNETLRRIADTAPRSPDCLSRIPGIGPRKTELYGDHFLSVIRRYKSG